MANRTILTPEKRAEFLDHLFEHGNVTVAARSIGVSRSSLYEARERDADFAAAWDNSVQSYCDLLEYEADRRAMTGVEKPLLYKGAIVAHVQEYSDALLMFRLKSLRPEKYRERASVEHGGQGGGPLEIHITRYAAPKD
jgi:hypothetical protein